MTIPLEADIGKDNDDAKGHTADLYACMSQQVYNDVGLGQQYICESHIEIVPSQPAFVYVSTIETEWDGQAHQSHENYIDNDQW